MKVRRIKHHTPEYDRLHYWVRKQWGQPNGCEHCDNPSTKRFEWANLSGQYLKERSDWARLCISCHRKLDGRDDKCPQGHEFTAENSYFNPKGHRSCRVCARFYVRQNQALYPEKQKLRNKTYRQRLKLRKKAEVDNV